ncbi:hypothetical protein ICE_01616 [Bacillus cereus BAG1X1-2]|uniref:MltR family transcriptional regulator n=1 Tax=Bacillus cereus TaxID=1396 RepID=UPI00027A7D02|nr:MltR family transcriptional regulator [Bacillus cereus]EJS59061.1 hypothetical protein ICE_01616 [Bacillus cereus BAG1X1-2]
MSTNQAEFKELYEKLDPIQWRKELEKEIANQSDRAIAIVCASIIDLQLKDILKEFMIKRKEIDKDLFEGNSPLSNFSSKIKMCYYLGLISSDEYKNLDRIRKIRNMFAHQLINISFENNQSIRDTCNNLNIPKNRYIPKSIPFPETDGTLPKLNLNPFEVDNSPKNRFVQVFYYLSFNFLQRVSDLQIEGYREEFEIKKSTADLFRERKEKFLEFKEKSRKEILLKQLEINQNEEKNGLEKTVFKDQEDGPYLKMFMEIIDQYDYIATVLENSYEK